MLKKLTNLRWPSRVDTPSKFIATVEVRYTKDLHVRIDTTVKTATVTVSNLTYVPNVYVKDLTEYNLNQYIMNDIKKFTMKAILEVWKCKQ